MKERLERIAKIAAKPKLIIKIKDKNINKVLEIAEKNDLDYTMSSSGLVIDASDKKNNKALEEIMKISDYKLTNR